MPDKISPLQMTVPQSWAGLTTDNHLGTIFNEQPDLISTVMSRLYGVEYYMGLDSLLSYMGGEEERPSDVDVEWYLKGDDEKPINIMSFEAEDMAKPCIGNGTAKLVLEEDFFQLSDVLNLDDRNVRVRVVSDGMPEGLFTAYTIELISGDATAFIDPSLLVAGRQVAKEYSAVERTLAKNRGGVSHTSPFKLRNSYSALGKEYTIPANTHQRPMVIELMDPKSNQTTKIWSQYAEWSFMCQWYREKNRQLMYGQSNKTASGTYVAKGETGFPVIEGSGLREQISPAYKFYYTEFDLERLEDILLQLSINILPEDKREFIALTGSRGMVQFHRSLQNYAHRFQPLDSHRIFGSGQNLGFGGQYRSYKGPEGIIFTVVKLPEYDNPIHNRIEHPKGGPTESYRYTILNFGTHKGKKNIRRLYPKGLKENMWYVPGSHSPMGPVGSKGKMGMGASKVHGYQMNCQTSQMLVVENPLSCAEFIYRPQV